MLRQGGLRQACMAAAVLAASGCGPAQPQIGANAAQSVVPLPPAPPGGADASDPLLADLASHPDKADLLARHRRLVRRNGPVLSFGGQSQLSFTDSGSACDGFETCERYRLDDVWGERFVGVSWSHGEGGGYLLVDTNFASSATELGDAPHFSPSGDRFFVAYFSEQGDWDGLMGASVWRATGWQGPVRLRVVDAEAGAYAPRFVGWRGERCVEFSAVAREQDGRMGPRRTLFLVDEREDWRLSRRKTAECE